MAEKMVDAAVETDLENILDKTLADFDTTLDAERRTRLEFYIKNLAKFLKPPFTFKLPSPMDLTPPENPSEEELAKYRRKVAKETASTQLFRPNNQFQIFIFLSGLIDDRLIRLTPDQKVLLGGYIGLIRAMAIENGRTLRTVTQMRLIKMMLKRIINLLKSMREDPQAA